MSQINSGLLWVVWWSSTEKKLVSEVSRNQIIHQNILRIDVFQFEFLSQVFIQNEPVFPQSSLPKAANDTQL